MGGNSSAMKLIVLVICLLLGSVVNGASDSAKPSGSAVDISHDSSLFVIVSCVLTIIGFIALLALFCIVMQQRGECKLREISSMADICQLTWALLLVGLAFASFVLCLHGLNELPKCRYGGDSCRFARQQCDFQGNNCRTVFKKFAIEGDSHASFEQLAIPYVTSLVSIVPAVLLAISTICGSSMFRIDLVKFFITAVAVSSLLSIRVVDELTFDCRWWRNENQDKCKEGFNAFAAGAFFVCLVQIVCLTIAVHQNTPVKQTTEDGRPKTQAYNDGA